MIATILNVSTGQILADKVRYCNNIFKRMVGLLGTSDLQDSEACWLIPCNSIHTFGMQYPLDAIVLDKNNRVIDIIQELRPNRLSKMYLKGHSIIEFKSGPQRPYKIGDSIKGVERSKRLTPSVKKVDRRENNIC